MFQPENTFKVLVTSNLHIGYAEREPLRSQDSVDTLQEILQIAKGESVDFILIAGDLFNESRPSRLAVHNTLELLRNQCWGNAPISIECLNNWADPQKQGSVSLQIPNFLDPNINVELPIFAINGFSDDPSGLGNLSELDTLAKAGVMDYYGKLTSTDTVHISPLLLRKGESLLCLYPLGAIREELLEKLIKDKNMSFFRPLENGDSWFSLFVVHQDHGKGFHRSVDSLTQLVEPWMDLVVSGRNHQSLTDIQLHHGGFKYVQPGSTIRTSFSQDEVDPKHVLILEICGKQSRVRATPLKTVRPMVLDRFVWDGSAKTEGGEIKDFAEDLKKTVHKLINHAAAEREGNMKLPWPPVVQIGVDIPADQPINPIKLGQDYADVVANPKSMFKVFVRRANSKIPAIANGNGIKQEGGLTNGDKEPEFEFEPGSIEELVLQDLTKLEKQGEFGVLHPRVVMKAMNLLLEKDDSQAISSAYDWEKDRMREHMVNKEGVNVDDPSGDMAIYHIEHRSQEEEESFLNHHKEVLARPPLKVKLPAVKAALSPNQIAASSVVGSSRPAVATAIRGRGRGRPRGGRAGAAAKRARQEIEEDEEELDEILPAPAAPSQGTRRSGRSTANRVVMYDGVEDDEAASDESEEFPPAKPLVNKKVPSGTSKVGFAVRGGRGGGRSAAAQVYLNTDYNPLPTSVAISPKQTVVATARAGKSPTGVAVRTVAPRGRAAAAAAAPAPANGPVWRIISSTTTAAAPAPAPRGRRGRR